MTGTEHVPRSGGVLLAFNHISYVDFVYGGLAAHPSKRLVRFMSKRELFDHRWTGPLMRSLHHIEVDRGDGVASFETAVEFLRAGEVVGIFPEATISRAMELKELKTGAVRIAAAAGVPLVPVILWGTQRLMTKDHPRDFSRGTPIRIRVGPAVAPDGGGPGGRDRRAARPRWPSSSTRRSRRTPTRTCSRAPGGSRPRTGAAHRPWTRRSCWTPTRSAPGPPPAPPGAPRRQLSRGRPVDNRPRLVRASDYKRFIGLST